MTASCTKLYLLLLFLTSTNSALLAQTDTLFTNVNPRRIALYHVQIRQTTGGQVYGILYALTDSTIIYFNHTRAAIQAFRHGQLPNLDTLSATAVKRLVVHRRGQPWRALLVGSAIGAGVSVLLLTMAEPGLQGLAVAFFVISTVLPFGPIIGGIVGLASYQHIRINGEPNRLARKRRRLNQHTIETQRQQLRLRTGLAG